MEKFKPEFFSWVDIPYGFTGKCYIRQTEENRWLVNGKRHRLDGPAVVSTTMNYVSYYINDIHYMELEWLENKEVVLHGIYKKMQSILEVDF